MKKQIFTRKAFRYIYFVILLTVGVSIFLYSCKKNNNSPVTINSNFFEYSGSDAKIISTINKLKSLDLTENFTKYYINRGNLDWAKALMRISSNKSDMVIAYKIPFVKSDNNVTDFLYVTTNSKGEIQSPVLCDYLTQFSNHSSELAKLNTSYTLNAFKNMGFKVPKPSSDYVMN